MDFGVKMDTSSGPPAASAGGGSTTAPLQGFTDKDVQGGVWTGMTIKDILEKVDLFNITTEDEPTEGKDVKPNIKNNFTKVSKNSDRHLSRAFFDHFYGSGV